MFFNFSKKLLSGGFSALRIALESPAKTTGGIYSAAECLLPAPICNVHCTTMSTFVQIL